MVAVRALSAPVSPELPFPAPTSAQAIRWFSARGSVVRASGRTDVFVGGTLIGSFDDADLATRDVLLACLGGDPFTRLGRLANAFEISTETLRQIRMRYRSGGVAGVLGRPRRTQPRKLTQALRRRLFRAFDAGLSVSDAHEHIRAKVSRATVGAVRVEWAAKRALSTGTSVDEAASPESAAPPVAAQAPLSTGAEQVSGGDEGLPPAPVAQESDELVSPPGADSASADVDARLASEDGTPATASVDEDAGSAATKSAPILLGSVEELRGRTTRIHEHQPISGRGVQHLGTWLMIAIVVRMGLYRCAQAARPEAIASHALRIALDAVTVALCIGERCIEGVRRIATPTARLLLRCSQAPSATWVRRVLGTLAAAGRGEKILFDMADEYLRVDQATAKDSPTTFYVDGHLRPYTGQATIRKGWRMQDKRVVAGISDYYVHDADGRPVFRVDVPSHGSLTTWLSPIAEFLKQALGEEAKLLIAFDRGGAFPEQMAELRDAGVGFVTYERAPYAAIPSSAFIESLDYRDETVAFCETRLKNLGQGRGRVRRIAFRGEDGRQINVLAVSSETPEALYRAIRGRWSQENGFKHQNERWGINQLDGRTTRPCDPDSIIPNPGRRRLDAVIKIERAREGRARNELAQLAPEDPKRHRWEEELAEAMANVKEFVELRPAFPLHAPLKETDLAGRLVEHPGEYKALIDTVRVACANAETELAHILAGGLVRPEEAKRVLQNLLLAPGDVQVDEKRITISIRPAGTMRELRAIADLLAECSRWDLTLPGDLGNRLLRFQLQS